jgi:cytochrome c peroxidase
MFWDSRVEIVDGQLKTPAGPNLPAGLNSVLAAQAMFPVTSRAEMRGFAGDRDAFGNPNELAQLADDDLSGIWQALMKRLQAIPEYNRMLQDAYPDTPVEQLGFQHVAEAMAAFEADAFSALDSAWDRYLAGDNRALSESAKRGAHLFYGSANCASCHAGSLLTDQQHHNLCVPQLGPGKDAETGLDPGRALVTHEAEDEFTFRTPPLRNVAATGPWMHNGAYTNLEDAVRHHLDPEAALDSYDVQQLDAALRPTVRMDAETITAIVSNIDALLPIGTQLSDQDMDDLMAFLFSLTSPSLDTLPSLVPDAVPSGLPVDHMRQGTVKILYDDRTGELRVDGPEGTELTSVMLRIGQDDDVERPDQLKFFTQAAAWSDETEIVLSDDEFAQSFLEYRKGSPFRLGDGDSLGSLLPPGLSRDSIEGFLAASYMLQGSLALWSADVVYVPEPASLWAWTWPVLAFGMFRRSRTTLAVGR